MTTGARYRRLLTLSGNFAAAAIDQAAFLGGNLLVLVFLARWLPPSEFGMFSLMYGGILLFLLLHGAVVSEPAVVFGAGRFSTSREGYFRLVAALYLRLTVLLLAAVCIITVGLGITRGVWTPHIVSTMCSAASIGMATLIRRYFYVLQQPRLAVVGSATHMALAVSGIVALHAFQRLTVLSAMIALIAGASVASAISWRVFRWSYTSVDSDTVDTKSVLLAHWDYGAWAAGTAALLWISTSGFLYLLSAVHGLESAAVFRMVQNLVNPFTQAVAAAVMLLLPVLSRRDIDHAHHLDLVKNALASTLLVGSCVVIAAWVSGRFVLAVVYGQHTVVPQESLIAGSVFAASGAVLTVMKTALRSQERSREVFVLYACVIVPLMLFGIELVRRWDNVGAFMTMAVMNIIGSLALWTAYRKRFKEHNANDRAAGRAAYSVVDS